MVMKFVGTGDSEAERDDGGDRPAIETVRLFPVGPFGPEMQEIPSKILIASGVSERRSDDDGLGERSMMVVKTVDVMEAGCILRNGVG